MCVFPAGVSVRITHLFAIAVSLPQAAGRLTAPLMKKNRSGGVLGHSKLK
jgi:hypothetical protein